MVNVGKYTIHGSYGTSDLSNFAESNHKINPGHFVEEVLVSMVTGNVGPSSPCFFIV